MWKIGDDEFLRCPRSMVTVKSIGYLYAYIFFEKGYLPNPGGWLAQPLKFVQAIQVIEQEIAKLRQEKD
jgi:hypothetical protein